LKQPQKHPRGFGLYPACGYNGYNISINLQSYITGIEIKPEEPNK